MIPLQTYGKKSLLKRLFQRRSGYIHISLAASRAAEAAKVLR